jgi:hypothetical protein
MLALEARTFTAININCLKPALNSNVPVCDSLSQAQAVTEFDGLSAGVQGWPCTYPSSKTKSRISEAMPASGARTFAMIDRWGRSTKAHHIAN